jgi:hypothetical protein
MLDATCMDTVSEDAVADIDGTKSVDYRWIDRPRLLEEWFSLTLIGVAAASSD